MKKKLLGILCVFSLQCHSFFLTYWKPTRKTKQENNAKIASVPELYLRDGSFKANASSKIND
ncbi:CLUMA_CG010273, isoform A [Clunio marinus]|uniref:CLUMA_CG010273, isoform A n=1 Tax=Clunio marinus TaxID=568069 RepID=A0A1J1I9A0_9DIPT|nr:CLUMA_CG010273, isoform A [Clunio marinus]